MPPKGVSLLEEQTTRPEQWVLLYTVDSLVEVNSSFVVLWVCANYVIRLHFVTSLVVCRFGLKLVQG